jgi:hypothetical protein
MINFARTTKSQKKEKKYIVISMKLRAFAERHANLLTTIFSFGLMLILSKVKGQLISESFFGFLNFQINIEQVLFDMISI